MTDIQSNPVAPGPRTEAADAALAERGRTFRRRSLVSLAWTLGGTGAQRGLSLVSNLIMTRLLVPEAFGLMAMVITITLLVEMLSDIGVNRSVVRSERGEEHYFLRVAWTVKVVRGVFMAAVVLLAAGALWLLAPSLAPEGSVYAEPQLPALIAVASLMMVLRGFDSVGIFRDMRRMQLRRNTILAATAQMAGLATMLILAWTTEPSVWTLLWGMLASGVFQTAMSHLMHRDLIARPVWDREIAAEMWEYGRWIIGASIAGFVLNNGGRFILGGLLDLRTFGLFTIGMLWVQAGSMVLDRVANTVVFSAFAEKLRDRRDEFAGLLGKARLGFYGILVAAFACAFLGAEILIGLLYTPEYQMAATFLILQSTVFLTKQQTLAGSILLAEGHSATVALATSIAAVAMVACTFAAWYTLGVEAAVLATALMPVVTSPFLFAKAKQAVPAISIRWDLAMAAGIVVAGLLAYLRVT